MGTIRSVGAFALPGTYTGGAGSAIVGRTVANSQFLRALLRFGACDSYTVFTGINQDREDVERLLGDLSLPPGRLRLRANFELPEAITRREVDVLHFPAHVDDFADLIALRNRYATAALPVTSQIHSLSYPRMLQSYLRYSFVAPAACDAIFCSSEGGRRALAAGIDHATALLHARGAPPRPLPWRLPVVPLGIDTDALANGDRARMRQLLQLPDQAVVVLVMGRFTEYDKMDLFPLVQAFGDAVSRMSADEPPLYLVLAGSRQGTKTPEMLQVWARAYGVGDRLRLRIDFPENEKRDLLAASDLFVSISDNMQETFGLSVIEAMAGGLPVIASDFDGYKETVTDEVGIRVPTRWVFDSNALRPLSPVLYERPLHLYLGQSLQVDLPALRDALLLLARDPARRATLGQAGRQRAVSVYDWRAVIARYEEVWRDLTDAGYDPRAQQALTIDFGMPFQDQFGHYASETLPETKLVRRSPLAELLCQGRVGYAVYPELRHAVVDSDVLALLETAVRPVTVGALRAQARTLATADGRDPWKGEFTVGWMLKQALLISADDLAPQ